MSACDRDGKLLPQPVELWSLWEMLKLETSGVLFAYSYIGGSIKTFQYGRTEILSAGHVSMNIEMDAYAHLVLSVERLQSTATAFGMNIALAALNRAHEALAENYSPRVGYDSERLARIIDALNPAISSFGDELASRIVVSLSVRHAALYSPRGPLFGDNVELKFPDATEDIAEAGKCLAVERSTACVFHLMRAMEIAVQALSAKLGVGRVDREWGKLLSDITSKIEVMPRGTERDRWSEARTHLYHVKQAWRNNTMHPKQTYTMEESGAVFEAVRVFMIDLAALV